MMQLFRKDFIVMSRFFIALIMIYLFINLYLGCMVVSVYYSPLPVLKILKPVRPEIFILLMLLYGQLFVYILIFRENFLFTLSLNKTRMQIYTEKLLLGLFFNLINAVLLLVVLYIYNFFGGFYNFFTFVSDTAGGGDFFYIVWDVFTSVGIVMHFGVLRNIIKNYPPKKRVLIILSLVILYAFLAFIISIYMHSSYIATGSQEIYIAEVLLINALIHYVNILLVKKVDG